MTKEETIKRYGIEEYVRRNEVHKEYMRKTDYNRKYQAEHPEKAREKTKKYHQNHPEKAVEYNHTVKGRAVKLVNQYNQVDKRMGRFENNISSDYLVNVLFPKGCAYCGEKDPKKLGADRIDNNRGHSADNVVCSCAACNKNRHKKDFVEYFFERYIDSILE